MSNLTDKISATPGKVYGKMYDVMYDTVHNGYDIMRSSASAMLERYFIQNGNQNQEILESQAKNLAQFSSYQIPATKVIPDNHTLYKLFEERVEKTPNDVIIKAINPESGVVSEYKASEIKEQVIKVASGLMNLGIKKGESVSIMSHTRYEWTVLDLAIQAIGGVTVPIYETSSESQIEFIVKDANVKCIFAEDLELASKCQKVRDKLNASFLIMAINNNAFDILENEMTIDEKNRLSEVEARQNKVSADDISAIVYTSGSTGSPKGVVLGNRGFLAVAYDALSALPELIYQIDSNLLLFLPLAHGFARLCQYAMLASDGLLTLSSNIKTLIDDLKVTKPTVILGVPRIFKKVYNAASHKASSGTSKMLFGQATAVAIEYAKETQKYMLQGLTKKDAINKLDSKLKAKHMFYNRIIYSKILGVLGGKAKYAVSGGAPLNSQIAYFFRGAGLDLLEGYGLTETAAPCFVNRPSWNRVGTIGPVFPGCNAAITEEGELVLNTPYTFLGYHNNDKASKDVLKSKDELPKIIKATSPQVNNSDIWFLTGDLADIDEYGFVRITGRKKDIIVTAGGKNISPTMLENAIDSEPIIASSVVLGDNMPFISVLITLDQDELNKYCDRIGRKHFSDIKSASKDSEVILLISKAIENANTLVSRAESIRKFRILDENFTEEAGTLTPSMKIRRPNIIIKYAKVIEDIYK